MAETRTGTRDVLDLLREEDREIESLLHRYFGDEAAGDHVVRGSLAEELRSRLAEQDAAKEILIHRLALDVGRKDLAEQLDDNARQRRELLARIDELTAGVSPRDMHIGVGAELDQAFSQLRDILGEHLRYESDVVVPALRQAATPEQLNDLAHQVLSVKQGAPTRPSADDPLEHERNPVARRIKGIYDRLRDYADAPQHHTDSLR